MEKKKRELTEHLLERCKKEFKEPGQIDFIDAALVELSMEQLEDLEAMIRYWEGREDLPKGFIAFNIMHDVAGLSRKDDKFFVPRSRGYKQRIEKQGAVA